MGEIEGRVSKGKCFQERYMKFNQVICVGATIWSWALSEGAVSTRT